MVRHWISATAQYNFSIQPLTNSAIASSKLKFKATRHGYRRLKLSLNRSVVQNAIVELRTWVAVFTFVWSAIGIICQSWNQIMNEMMELHITTLSQIRLHLFDIECILIIPGDELIIGIIGLIQSDNLFGTNIH